MRFPKKKDPNDSWSRERPAWSLAPTQPVRITPPGIPGERKTNWRFSGGLFSVLLALAILFVIYLLIPLRTTVLILGTDSRTPGDFTGRTDTMVLLSVVPLKPEVNMLSIPRDLWVPIPGYGENRINAAHFFAEAEEPGTGPALAIETIRQNFMVQADYYARVRFDSVIQVVDAMGGVQIDLPEPMSGYPAGTHTLDGTQALAFIRDRSGSDDFFRMQRGQLFLRAFLKKMISPAGWLHLPSAAAAAYQAVDTNFPWWLAPRVGLALLRAGPDGINGQTITRELVTPTTTADGANVLIPDWDAIQPLLTELFR